MSFSPYQMLSQSYGVIAQPEEVRLQTPGFSGAVVWQVTPKHARDHSGPYCLRKWPPGFRLDRILWIHNRLEQFQSSGASRLAVPLRSLTGETFVTVGGHHYELARWLPGVADFAERPTEKRLESAMQALAEIHEISSKFDVRPDLPVPSKKATSAGLNRRLQGLERTLAGRLDRIVDAVGGNASRETVEVVHASNNIVAGVRRLGPNALSDLRDAANMTTEQTVCLRDVWHDHILFTGDAVTGIVDYDAMEIESPAGDVARLLGSLVGNRRAGWEAGLAAYTAVRTVSDEFRDLTAAFDMGNRLLSGLQWLEWRFVDRHSFATTEQATSRIFHWAERFRAESSENG
ncbi:MAG: phosphotransferase [Planctomycetota bacterium]